MGLIAARDSIHLSHFVSPADNSIAAFCKSVEYCLLSFLDVYMLNTYTKKVKFEGYIVVMDS